MRLFLGSFLSKELRNLIPLTEIRNKFQEKIKPIKEENIHLTWLFIGDVDIEVLKKTGMLLPEEIIERHVSLFQDITFSTEKMEFWPPKRPPRLIVLSGKLNHDLSLAALCTDLHTIASPEMKDNFLPHITVARFKKDCSADKNTLLPEIRKIKLEVKNICLVNSTLTSTGPVYQTIKRWELG